MRTILFSIILFFLLGGYASDILNAAPACTWRYKWVWDGATRYACEVQIPSAGCGINNGRQKRTAKCVREDGDGTSVAVAVANCATWDPYTGAKSLIETYDNGTCTMPCNASCGTSHTTNVASQPSMNLCDAYSTIAWTDTTAVASDYTYNWNCNSSNGGTNISCWAGKQTNGSCNNTVALGCSIGSAYNDNGQTACSTTRTWQCTGLNGGSSSAGCSKANPVCIPVVNGVCGGLTELSTLTTGSCTAGTKANDIGTSVLCGSHTWDCMGSGGGTNAIGCSGTPTLCCEPGGPASWAANCSGSWPATAHGSNYTVVDSTAPGIGNYTATCSNHAWTYVSSTCAP